MLYGLTVRERDFVYRTRSKTQIDFIFSQGGNDLAVVNFALESARRQDQGRDSARGGAVNSLRAFAIGDDDGNLRVGNPAGGNTVRQGFKVRAASAE